MPGIVGPSKTVCVDVSASMEKLEKKKHEKRLKGVCGGSATGLCSVGHRKNRQRRSSSEWLHLVLGEYAHVHPHLFLVSIPRSRNSRKEFEVYSRKKSENLKSNQNLLVIGDSKQFIKYISLGFFKM